MYDETLRHIPHDDQRRVDATHDGESTPHPSPIQTVLLQPPMTVSRSSTHTSLHSAADRSSERCFFRARQKKIRWQRARRRCAQWRRHTCFMSKTGPGPRLICALVLYSFRQPPRHRSSAILKLFVRRPQATNPAVHRLSPTSIRPQKGPVNNVGGHKKPFRHSGR